MSSKMIALLLVSCACGLAQEGDWRLAILKKLSPYTLTKATADRSTIVTAGTVFVLRKDGLRLFTLEHRFPPGNTYADGMIKESFLGKTTPDGPARTFVAGEKLWVTKVLFEARGDGVVLEFLSDPFGDTRYFGTLKFPFPKGSPPTPDDFARTVSQVIKADVTPPGAPVPAVGTPQTVAVAPPPPPAPVEQALPPIAPPPPPADQQPPTVSLGQTKDEVVGNFGQPVRIANLGTKQILYYKDFKVTLVNGKVTDVQ